MLGVRKKGRLVKRQYNIVVNNDCGCKGGLKPKIRDISKQLNPLSITIRG